MASPVPTSVSGSAIPTPPRKRWRSRLPFRLRGFSARFRGSRILTPTLPTTAAGSGWNSTNMLTWMSPTTRYGTASTALSRNYPMMCDGSDCDIWVWTMKRLSGWRSIIHRSRRASITLRRTLSGPLSSNSTVWRVLKSMALTKNRS